jgi:DNA invertase Pin-like site-specific DNA recombinase
MTPAASTPAIIYCRVSSDKQGASGLGIEGQEARCREVCTTRGWEIVEVVHETISGDKARRPLFQEACAKAKASGAVIVAAEASRLTRQRGGVLPLYEQAAKEGWAIYALDMPEIDPLSPMGEAVITIIGAINRLERRLTGQRTSASLRAKVARGEPVGRPRVMPAEIIEQITTLRGAGLSYSKVAEALNERGVRGPDGGTWVKQSVHQTCKRFNLTGGK